MSMLTISKRIFLDLRIRSCRNRIKGLW